MKKQLSLFKEVSIHKKINIRSYFLPNENRILKPYLMRGIEADSPLFYLVTPKKITFKSKF